MATDPTETQVPEELDVTQAVAEEPTLETPQAESPETPAAEIPAVPEPPTQETPAAETLAEPDAAEIVGESELLAAQAAEAPDEAQTPEAAASPEPEAASAPEPEAAVTTESPEAASEPGSAQTAATTGTPAEATPAQAPKWPVPVWPFLVYDLVWLAGAGVLVWQLIETPDGAAVYDAPAYSISIYVAIGLAAAAPVLALIVWLASRRRMKVAGALGSSVLRASAATALGMVIWWVALVVVDYLRLGRVF